MKKVSLLVAFAIMMGVGSMAFANDGKKMDLKVSDSAVATAIADRMPEGKASEFNRDITTLYYWTRIEGAMEPTEVKHIWYHGDKNVGEVTLKVTSSNYRTWSSKTITPDFAGDMSVEVVDANGKVLQKDSFKIK